LRFLQGWGFSDHPSRSTFALDVETNPHPLKSTKGGAPAL
jgi:hypothetical protein